MPLLTKDTQESQKALSKLIARTWLDEAFKERFILEPAAVLEENGLTFPSNVLSEIPLPPKPTGLTDQQIQSWADGDDPSVCF